MISSIERIKKTITFPDMTFKFADKSNQNAVNEQMKMIVIT